MVFRAPAADRAGTLQRYPQNNRESAFANVRDAPGRTCWRSPSATPGGDNPGRDRASALKRDIAAVNGGTTAINQGLAAYRAGPDRPAQTQALHQLLERQHYRLAHWKLATSEINYRRFFDVNSLAGLARRGSRYVRPRSWSRPPVDRGKQDSRLAARSYRRIARSGAILPASVAPDPRSPGLPSPPVLSVDRKNSRRIMKRCRSSPASTGRRAMSG